MAHGLMVALGPAHDDEDEHSDDSELDGLSPEEHTKAKEDAVKAMMASVRTGKSEDFRKALEAFIDLHDAEEDQDDEQDELGDEEKDESDEDDLRL